MHWIRFDFYGMYRAFVQKAQLAPVPNIQYTRGMMAVLVNRPQEAVDLITPVDPEGPGIIAYWRDLTFAHHMLGNYKKELKVARRGRRQDPDNMEVYEAEIRALAALGKIKEVNEFLDESLALHIGEQNYGWILIYTAVNLRVHSYKEASFHVLERAIKWFESRPKKEAETRLHRIWLATALYTAERWEEAQVLFENLHNEFPESLACIGFLGTLAARRGDRDEALRISGILENMERPYLRGFHTFFRANIEALLGEEELAVKLLQEAHAQGINFQLFYYNLRPNVIDLEPLHDYPPYKEFMRPKG
jgi:tetratricopeptide (TPR) repeat protein